MFSNFPYTTEMKFLTFTEFMYATENTKNVHEQKIFDKSIWILEKFYTYCQNLIKKKLRIKMPTIK